MNKSKNETKDRNKPADSACYMAGKMEEKEIKFAVMKLCKSLEYESIFGEHDKIEVSGIAGFIPVFNTIEEAEENSQDGKYKIMALRPG